MYTSLGSATQLTVPRGLPCFLSLSVPVPSGSVLSPWSRSVRFSSRAARSGFLSVKRPKKARTVREERLLPSVTLFKSRCRTPDPSGASLQQSKITLDEKDYQPGQKRNAAQQVLFDEIKSGSGRHQVSENRFKGFKQVQNITT